MGEQESRTSGLTWRAYLAIVFLVVIVLPSMIYYYLVTGQGLTLSTWIIILVWVEITRVSGRPLTKQEIFIMLAFESMAIAAGPAGQVLDLRRMFVEPLRYFYFATSPAAQAFGYAQVIPSWWSPPPSMISIIYGSRTFLNAAWAVPIGILLLSAFFGLVANVALGYFTYQLYVSVQKLSFPAQAAAADAIVTLTEPGSSRFRVLILSIFVGIIYNVFSVFVPYVLNPPAQAGAIPLTGRGAVDFTSALEVVLPGASFAFTGDLMAYMTGLLVPVSIAVFQFVGAFGLYFVGNALLTRYNFWPKEFQWTPGLGASQLIGRSQLYFWNSAMIGLSIAVALVPMLLHPRRLISAFGSMAKVGRGAGERVSQLWVLLGLFFGSSLASVLLVHFLAPDFPIWILIVFMVGWSFLATFVSALASGVTYGSLQIPYMREVTIYYSGYRQFNIWLAPLNVYTGGASVCGALLQADIVKAKHSDYVKSYFLIAILSLVMSFVVVSYLWITAPIPSGAYPYTITNWPIEALDWWRYQSWLWTGYMFRSDFILGGLAIGSAAVVVTDLLKVPYAMVGVLAGPYLVGAGQNPLAWSLAMLTGSILSRYGLSRVISGDRWSTSRNQFVVGFIVGDSLMYTLLAVTSLGIKSMWLLPY